MRFANGWVVAFGLVACAESSPPCEPQGQAFDASEGRFCLYSSDSPLVIQGGFECPAQLPFRFDTEAGIACSERDLPQLPESVCERLGAECEEGIEPSRPGDPSGEGETGGGMAPGSSEEDPWWAVTRERGYIGVLEGKDFFQTMQAGCILDMAPPPTMWQQLVQESDRVVLASIAEIVVDPELPPPRPAVEEDLGLYLRLDVNETAKGDAAGTLLVLNSCDHGALVAPMRERRPEGSFVFFLGTAADSGDPRADAYLMYYYAGIVRENENGVRFALGDGGYTLPSLAEFDSLEALLDAVAAQDSP
jgi:hypothetical protein